MKCPLNDPAQCELHVSAEETPYGLVLQTNCQHCGSGSAVRPPAALAEAATDEPSALCLDDCAFDEGALPDRSPDGFPDLDPGHVPPPEPPRNRPRAKHPH
ncbi:MAG: hypothetical protein M3Q42_11795 [Pseudomonadota bacterium]|nr:hypothetical protein [Pseudomonadota bacterium]